MVIKEFRLGEFLGLAFEEKFERSSHHTEIMYEAMISDPFSVIFQHAVYSSVFSNEKP